MKLDSILKNLSPLKTTGDLSIEISGIQFDSRAVEKGNIFVATRGTAVDGHDFIDAAIEKGAAAIVCESQKPKTKKQDGVTFVEVSNSAEALGIMACNWYGNPSENLQLAGVTGTNGKTTIATLLYQLFRKLGYKSGLLSTVCNYIEDEAVEATHTTPDPLELNRLLARMVEAGCQYAFMEVSSHAVEQRRIAGLKFAGGIFTNLTRDHIDYHETVENYLKAKKRFFDELPAGAFTLTNLDDKNGLVMLQNSKAKKYTYSLRSMADFKTRILEHGFEGMLLDINGQEVNVSFIGKFNASNVTAVFGAAILLGQDKLEVLRIISSLHSVSGRFETLRSPNGYTAIVDYAHTPDALNNVISTINDMLQGTNGRLITVVGCGGNRDKGKRPMMAREAVNGSWKAILTSDNPRNEDPQEILNDMLAGLDNMQKKNSLTVVDRREAIKTACALAQKGDVVLIAGKGHEDYQIIQGVKYHFDDREEIRNCLETHG
jgi:UDP-N-acetylmuramoyl-L-alanyl-D-glutamate--2,6-diaminopimelate ligase